MRVMLVYTCAIINVEINSSKHPIADRARKKVPRHRQHSSTKDTSRAS
jgi:hypothetical protein